MPRLVAKLAAIGATGLLVCSVTSCSLAKNPLKLEPSTTPSTTRTPRADGGKDIYVTRIKKGDCVVGFDDVPDLEKISTLPVIDCSKPHRAELFHVHKIEGKEYPGDEAVITEARTVCTGDAFKNFVGINYDDSSLEVIPVRPSEETWNKDHHRKVSCFAVAHDPVTGTLQDSKR